jgi:hypothetical protein
MTNEEVKTLTERSIFLNVNMVFGYFFSALSSTKRKSCLNIV